ncbi:MAG: chemotaxis protein CheC [Candidatus Methanoperedens sp.]|nr:chemotaxis protein CheC [Candidatus Methanoperedens sp.]
MDKEKTLTEFQKDALKELGSIGIGQVTTSLAKMVNQKVEISLPDMKFIPLIKVPHLIKNEEPMIGVIQELKGDCRGFLLLLLLKDSAKSLIKLVMGETKETDTFDEMEQSVMKELGNIMNGTYISALSNFLEIEIGLSPPLQAYDMGDAIINQLIGVMSQDADDVLFLKTEFFIHSEKVNGKILIFTDPLSISKILDAIKRIAEK